MSSLSSLTAGLTTLSGLALVRPQDTVGYAPQTTGSSESLGEAMLFHLETENKVSITNDITDHAVEDNTTLQDQIAIKPEIISVRGFIGELTNAPPNKVLAALRTVANKLVSIGAYTPTLSLTAIKAYNEAAFAYQLAESIKQSAVTSLDTITGASGLAVIGSNGLTNGNKASQNRQQIMFQKFYAYNKNRTLFTVQTPWAIFQNCAILSIETTQDETTAMITEFAIQFKPIKFASTIRSGQTGLTSDNFQGQSAAQASPEVDFGTQAPGQSVNFAVSGVA